MKTYSVEGLRSFVCCAVSPRGEYLLAITDDNILHSFDLEQKKEVHMMKVNNIKFLFSFFS